MSYQDSVNRFSEPNVNGYPVYNDGSLPLYPCSYPTSTIDTTTTIQYLFGTLKQKGEQIRLEGKEYNSEITKIRTLLDSLPEVAGENPKEVVHIHKSESPIQSPTVLTGVYSLAMKVVTKAKDYFFGDGLKLLGGMVAVLAVAHIMRKFPNTFAIPTLEGNWGVAYQGYSNRHSW